DLTYVAALDPTQVRFVSGRAPREGSGAGIEAALPQTAAQRLGLKPGAPLTLADRLGGPKVHVTLTGLYRPARADAPRCRLGVLDRVERSLLVSRSTLLIVALQLVLLACCALLLVARLLSTERAGEVRLLRARGASRARVASLAALEALFLAVPAVVCGPLLS